ncbi:leucyl aminopeptidase [Bdellovibrionota bacterium FG-2]
MAASPSLTVTVSSSGMFSGPGKLSCEAVFVFQDSAKKGVPPKGHYQALGERLRKEEVFSAALGSVEFVRFGGSDAVSNAVFVGLGQPSELTLEKLRSAGGSLWAKLKSAKMESVSICLDMLLDAKGVSSELSPTHLSRALAEGLVLGAYQFLKHKSKQAKSDSGGSESLISTGPSRFVFVTHNKKLKSELEKEFSDVSSVAQSVNLTRDWSNEPSNFGTPEFYAAEAKKVARLHGLKCRILTEADVAREKMGLFLGVGQGSEREGRVVVVEYLPSSKARKAAKTIAFVGKGVTFDSGGISLKPSLRMENMKNDMTGAATVMGAVVLAAKWKVPNRVIGIMAFTENMPDGRAIQPGNVITSRAGKTVEIINTDAEGRLILADVLDFAHDFKPDAIVDVATLTGAITVALGKFCCAIFGNENSLIDSVRRAGDSQGERIWEMPLFDEYFEDLKSECADMKNSANDTYGGAIRGAIFLKQFIRKGVAWAHLDIAATASDLTHLSYYPKKGASGAYVRTLARFAADF